MSDQPMYRWLEQQGEAFGAPGLEPRWTSSVKDAVVTAYSGSSRIWFTCSHGILNEIYHPTIDRAQVRDMEFLVTDGETFVHEEKRDMETTFEYIDPEALGVRYVNRDPDGRYSLTKEMICDPHHGVVLQRVRLEGREDLVPRLKAVCAAGAASGWRRGGELGAGDGPGGAQGAAGVEERVVAGDDGKLRIHADELRVCGRERRLAGPDAELQDGLGVWVGDERERGGDGRDRPGMQLGRAAERAGSAAGESDRGDEARSGKAVREFTLAIGIGEGHHTAVQKTMGALSMPFEEQRKRFIEQWKRAANPEWLAAKAQDGGKLMRASHTVLLAHEDKIYSGAFVASASIPWGQAKGDDDLGGYHLVWTRDMVQTATALLACGRAETARRALVYLACTQQPDGGFAQNFWIDGTPYWSGKQLDEVAFPIILAWRLWKAGGLGELQIFPFVERAAGFLVRHAPITHQERWEENAGYSPSTLAAVIGGLICAAEMARAHESDGAGRVSRGVCRLD